MKAFDNSGRLVSEITQYRTAEGKSITTNTVYNNYNGRPFSQNISVMEPNGKVSVASFGKLGSPTLASSSPQPASKLPTRAERRYRPSGQSRLDPAGLEGM
jgi:hypothetical protein